MQAALRLGLVLALGAGLACGKTTIGASVAPKNGKKVEMPASADTTKLAKSSNAFAFDIYGKVRSAQGNLAMSPASITAALAMTWGGARAKTEEQMRSVLHFERSRESVMTDWGTISQSLQSSDRPLKLRIANRLFGDKSTKFNAEYIEKIGTAFGAPLEALDFRTAAEPSRVHINAWVEGQTEKRVKDLLPQDSLNDLTRLVLVNAIYFLADWADPFEKSSTFPETFTLANGTQKKTPMMNRGGSYRAAQIEGLKILEMPYKGGDAAMVILLPDRADGLARVEQSLSAAKLETWMADLTMQRVAVSLPRFELSPASMSLGDVLSQLGMPDAFDRDKADFTGIANPPDPRERLKIDKVFHKAYVLVDEKGTEAAAATAVVAAAGGGPPPRMLEFNADHPFFFAIIDRPTGLILFVGRVADPTAT
jgi:serpin B